MIELAYGDTELTLAPAIGGSIAGFRWRGHDVMRPAGDARDALGMSAFPLVPWSNRIRDGRFEWDGRAVQLPPNYQDSPHSIHGHGWQRPWTVVARAADSATLGFEHKADAWPWDYHAEHRIALADDGLTSTLSVRNDGDRDMPAGLGLHPYFPNPPATTLHAALAGWWETDAEIMPVRYVAEGGTDWTRWLHAPATTDNVLAGLHGPITLGWPTHTLTITASAAAGWVVVYAPVGDSIAAVEAVTHPTDALNVSGTPGVVRLAPGATLTLETRFRVQPAPPPR